MIKSINAATTERRVAAGALPPDLWPNVDDIVTEDDTPVDSIFSEKQQRLLTETLYNAWPGPGDGRPFLAMANVGLFYAIHQPPLVPDALLSLDVQAPEDTEPKINRSYFVWNYGKPPDVVIEVVSNREGGEDTYKLTKYAQLGIDYYAIIDPYNFLNAGRLRLFRLHGSAYQAMRPGLLPGIGLGLKLWQGRYEDMTETWLRWFDTDGRPVPTGGELARSARKWAEQSEAMAEVAQARADRLAAQLRAAGIDPEA